MKPSFYSSFFLLILLHMSVEASEYEECKRRIQCGDLNDIGYPFYDEINRPEYCGYPGYKLNCSTEYGEIPEISVTESSEKYHLLRMDPSSHTIGVAPKDFWNTRCPDILFNTTLNYTLYKFTDDVTNFTLYYDCPPPSPDMISTSSAISYNCPNINHTLPGVYFTIDDDYIPPTQCHSNIIIPLFNQSVHILRDTDSVKSAFEKGFELEWIADNDYCDTCRDRGGECGYDFSQRNSTCYYDYGSSHLKKKLKTILIIIASSAFGLALIAVALLSFTKSKASQKLILTKEERKDSHDVEVVLKRYGEYAPKRYTYGEIKKMTSCFQDKLGEGGYGGVYKGKLQDGSPVAVKLLKKPNCKGTDFINEVASISETNHVNIVTLLGYCYQGRKRALVYEFLPNGSLDKYINCGQNQNSIAWETLLQIAISIGRGLEYLHQGCRTRILHFDIKPHNILLDAKFCPKISDFGLAKSYVETKSLMTMSGTRGTPGYIAPEVFCRGFGGASHKSDVYSFGMLVLDLVGCRKNSITGSEKTGSELYFPHYIYKQFELKEGHELLGISNDEEKEIQKKLVIVSLWCIQTNPSSRPSISRAVEMLEGDIELLQIPPIPFPSSPP